MRIKAQGRARSRASVSKFAKISEFVISVLFVGFISVVVLLLERELDSSVIVGALWAAPIALLTRSLSLTIIGCVMVCIAFILGGPVGQPRMLGDILEFISSGVLFMLASGVMHSRLIFLRGQDRRECDIFASAYSAVMCAVDNSNEPVIWLGVENDWIYCNMSAFHATGVSRISILTDMEGRAENDAMMRMMHSGSRDAWRRLVEFLNSMRAADGSEANDSLSPNSRLMGPVFDGNVIDTRIKLTDALGRSAIYALRVTMLEGGGALIHGKLDVSV